MSKYIEVQNRLSQILERADVGDRVSRNIDLFLMALVVVNIISITLEPVPHIYADHKNLFIWIEIISVGIFTIEYLCRVWVAPRQISGPSGFAGASKAVRAKDLTRCDPNTAEIFDCEDPHADYFYLCKQ